ncbi:hypothetical protein J2754_001322 [Halarchaeum solikamskense]|uniref:hypothetical protein n=1 Tax=Halarchaeum nitratireducens TaxID=489913 RepID=UPI001B3AEFC6|nr:hypothetical protein [Halarchaeum solikamskense]MBP2251001.1 hypothetical protein [Halarchaeum solikamskense]
MNRSRRALLGSLAAVTLGGCLDDVTSRSTTTTTTASDRDGDGVPDRGDDYPDDPDRAFRSFHADSGGATTLEPGDFQAFALTNSPEASGDVLHYEASVAGDTPIDCLVFERDAYDRYERGDRDVPIAESYSRAAVTETSLTARLDRGAYVFAVDYTDQTTPTGTGPVDVTYTLDLAEPRAEPTSTGRSTAPE